MSRSSEAITTVLREAQRVLTLGDPPAALVHLEGLPPAARTAPVVRLHGLCLILLNRQQEAHELVAAAEARHPSFPYVTLLAADLAWHRRDHWQALMAYLDALLQQPQLHNLWPRIIKITTALAAAAGHPGVTAVDQERFRRLLLGILDRLQSQPADRCLLEGLAHLLPLLAADSPPPHRHFLVSDYCRHALTALMALDKLE